MSQMTSDVKAVKAAWNVSVFVATCGARSGAALARRRDEDGKGRTATVRPRNAQAPTGSGSSTRPVMVDKNMASSDHACEQWGAGGE